jgi:transcriptional regulator with XRE-family HTH domain
MSAPDDTVQDPIQTRLRLRRRLLGLTLRSLADTAGIGSPAFVLSVENGTKVPSDIVARRLARALGEDE